MVTETDLLECNHLTTEYCRSRRGHYIECDDDLNECELETHSCNTTISNCSDIVGGYKCQCAEGYQTVLGSSVQYQTLLWSSVQY